MKRKCLIILVLALGASGMAGCFDAGAIVLSTRSKKKNSVPSALPVDPTYHVWVAQLSDAATASSEEAKMQTNGGIPDPAFWSEVSTGTASTIFMPAQAAGTFNSILVQVSVAQPYSLDAIEILDANDVGLATASGATYQALVANPGNALGPPDGQVADLTATLTQNAFFFSVFAIPISRFRVDLWGGIRGPGDVFFSSRWTRPGNQKPGGAALDQAGNILVTVSEPAGSPTNAFLARFDSTGTLMGTLALASGITATAGSHSVAVHTDGTVYVAVTATNGTILTRKYSADLMAPLWTVTFSSGLGGDRVEAHSLALDSRGDAIVAGGVKTLLNGIDPWMRKIKGTTDGLGVGGATLWTQTSALISPDLANTWWRGVAVDAAGDVYSTGDLSSLASSNIEIVTRKTRGATGAALWSTQFDAPDPPPDVGHSVALDGAGNVYVGGTLGTSLQGRDALLLKYFPSSFPSSFTSSNGPANQDDALLGLAVDVDGSLYMAGYVTSTPSTQVMWLRKLYPDGGVAWTRTYADAGGKAQAVDVLLSATTVVVVGFETLLGGETDLHIRSYEK